MGGVDLLSRQVVASKSNGAKESIRMRKVHGLINAITWGMMMPIGAILIARYLKFFNPQSTAWYYIHAACQSLAFIGGIVGFVTGIILGNKTGIHHRLHRNIGISLMCLASLQPKRGTLREPINNVLMELAKVKHSTESPDIY